MHTISKYELVALGFLSDGPKHAYRIYQEIKQHRMNVWARINLSLVYGTLSRLAREGLVVFKTDRQGNLPERRVYSLTAKGRTRLTWLVENFVQEDRVTEDHSNLGYFFIFCLPRDRALKSIQMKVDKLTARIKRLERLKADLEGKLPYNRYLIIEKDLGRFSEERRILKRVVKKIKTGVNWEEATFL